MERGLQGILFPNKSTTEPFHSFVPHGLPPVPPLVLDDALQDLLEKANRSLGRLDGAAMLLPDLPLFLYFYVRKEAVLSSQIEGTQSSLSDLLLFESNETPGVPLDDVQEVSNYVSALTLGVRRWREDFPFSLRLVREIHQTLLESGRGAEKQPGEFRRSQNWIGGSRPGNALYVPPPADRVIELLGQWEMFIHDIPQRTPTLIKAALMHVQFETVHPFLDGNGRLGRLLIPLLLCYESALHEPLLYLSLYFKANRQTYYDLLQSVRLKGDWEEWLRFFLEGVSATADQAASAAQRVLLPFEKDRGRIMKLGRSAGSAMQVYRLLQKKPLLFIPAASEALGLSQPTVTTALEHLVRLGIVSDNGRPRNRRFSYDAYLALLSEGTEPL